MPELPEVETVARGLHLSVAGRRIVGVTLGKTDFIDNPEDVERFLPGREIRVVERYGKFLLLRLQQKESASASAKSEEEALLVHLGMTGMLAPVLVEQPRQKHTHVVFLLDDGRELRYVDPRRFGRMAYLAGEVLTKELKRFGSDPLEVKRDEFVKEIQRRKTRIKALLLNQQVLRGVGNIYADESLWKAKIHPEQLGSKLKPEQLRILYRALQTILQNAILLRGSTISDFVDAKGQPGEYQQRHRVYGREGKPCFHCKTPIRRIIVAGRSSHFCPKCQPTPRKAKKKSGSRAASKRRASKR
ncbi:MAG TPA: bifunctional DNA-formamidopyrimidine glycosylase/DNA-(apurinic or apyrimidinic site) lyase [Candidatus Acidoferrum sp.]